MINDALRPTGSSRRWHSQVFRVVAAVENVTERRLAADRLSAIIDAQLAIADSELSPAKVMREICSHAAALTGAGGACIELRDEADLVCRAVAGTAGAGLGVRLSLAGSFSGLAVTTGRTLVCRDVRSDPRVRLPETCPPGEVRSMVVAPLRRGSDILGVIKVFSTAPEQFSDGDGSTLQLLAASFGAAMWRPGAGRRRGQAAGGGSPHRRRGPVRRRRVRHRLRGSPGS